MRGERILEADAGMDTDTGHGYEADAVRRTGILREDGGLDRGCGGSTATTFAFSSP